MKKAKVLKVTSYQNLLTTICCDRYNERCFERICEGCGTKSFSLCEDIDDDISVKYQQWESTQETIVSSKSKNKRTIVKQRKTTFEASPQDLVGKLESGLETIFSHERNIVHQHVAMTTLKASLRENDAVVHMDFSENYSTKYSEEIQSFHFGGSRTQISLHTVVATCKRTADSVVASGGDAANLTQFCSAIQNRCPNITLCTITTNDIEQMDALTSRGQPTLLPFKGTSQVHQVQGDAYMPQKVVMKVTSAVASAITPVWVL
nr:unnamed protein product [Callosobruchus analis]